MSAGAWIALGALGGAGAVLRHVVDAFVAGRTSHAMPWGIFVVNVSGAFALGLLAGADPGKTTAFVLGTGLLGAYTTFSTWMLQARVLLRDGRRRAACTYLAGSLIVGLLAVWAGRAIGASLVAVIDEFEADIEVRGDDLWVLPQGELDLAGAPELKETLSLALASDAQSIVVDLRGLDLIDSTGLRILLEAHGGEGGDRVSFVPGNDHVQGVLRVSGVLEELPFRQP